MHLVRDDERGGAVTDHADRPDFTPADAARLHSSGNSHAERAAAARLVHRVATSADDADQLLDALGLNAEQGDAR